jgi:hypothetical protein
VFSKAGVGKCRVDFLALPPFSKGPDRRYSIEREGVLFGVMFIVPETGHWRAELPSGFKVDGKTFAAVADRVELRADAYKPGAH